LYRLIKFKFPEFKGFYLHRVTNKFFSGLNFNDWVVGCHVVESRQIVGLSFDIINHITRHLFCINNLSMKLSSMRRHDAIKIHVVFCQCSCFIETAKLDNASCNDLVLGDAKDPFFI
jgi:hypothetical protein